MTTTTAYSHRLAAALLVVTALGCSRSTSETTTAADPSSSMRLAVQNSSDFQVNVFAMPSLPSARIRLGSVGPLSSDQLTVPQSAIGPGNTLKVVVDPVGSTTDWVSPSITVSSDTRPCLRVQADAAGDLGRSTLYPQISGGSSCQ